MDNVSETASATRNANHTFLTLPVSEKRYAAGIRATSWRHTDMMSEYIGLEKA
jgi:hypothetical protein